MPLEEIDYQSSFKIGANKKLYKLNSNFQTRENFTNKIKIH